MASPLVDNSSRSSRKHGSSHHGRSKTSRSASSPSRSSSSSGSSASRSRSRSSDHKRRHNRHHGKYSTLKYLPVFKTVTTYERLVLANLRMLCRFFKKERDINGMLDHFILLAEKAEKDVFIDEALLSYDKSVKDWAKEHGLKKFDTLNPSEIVKHLSYDGTKAGSSKLSRRAPKQQQQQQQQQQSLGFPSHASNFLVRQTLRESSALSVADAPCVCPSHLEISIYYTGV